MQQAPLGQINNNQMNYTIKSNTTGIEYQIIQQIGVGTEGIVYKGKLSNTNAFVAIKMLFSSNKKDGLEELKKKKYKHLINILDIIVQLDNTFLIMDCADGELYKYMQTQEYQNKTNEEKSKLFLQVVKGVEEIHQLNFIHRDIKPENVLYFRQENGDILLKLCDFGLLKNSAIFRKTPNIGTPYYWAPEIISDRQDTYYTNSVDIWALGMLWYEMLNGKPLFYSFQTVESLQKHIKGINQQWIDNEIDKCQQLDAKVKHLLKNKILLINTFPTQRATATQLVQELQFLLGYIGLPDNYQVQAQQLQGQQSNRLNNQQGNQLQFCQQMQQGNMLNFKPQLNCNQFINTPAQCNFIQKMNFQQNQSAIPNQNGFQNQGLKVNNQLDQKQFNNQISNSSDDQQIQKQLIQIFEGTIKMIQTDKQNETNYLKQQITKLEEQQTQYQQKIEALLKERNEMEDNHKKQFDEEFKKQMELKAEVQKNTQKLYVQENLLSTFKESNNSLQTELKNQASKNDEFQTSALNCIFQINQKILQYEFDQLNQNIQSNQKTYYREQIKQRYDYVFEKLNQLQENKQSSFPKLLEKLQESLQILESFTSQKLFIIKFLGDQKTSTESQSEINQLIIFNNVCSLEVKYQKFWNQNIESEVVPKENKQIKNRERNASQDTNSINAEKPQRRDASCSYYQSPNREKKAQPVQKNSFLMIKSVPKQQFAQNSSH